MIHIEKIKISNKTYQGTQVLKQGFEIICSDINLLVGNQGCGKSTLLQLLQQNHSDLLLTLSSNTIKNGIKSFYFDTEKDNPRIKDPEMYTKPDGTSKGIGMKNAILTRFQSHGEVLESFIISPLLNAKNSVILLDEPESGLSITNQFRLINAMEVAVKNDCQIFIATHCFPLIENYNVISLEHNKQMSGIDFIKKVKEI